MTAVSARASAAAALEGIEQVVAEPLRFKAKLAIGEEAYTSLRVVNRLRELWDVLGAAGTGAAAAKSSLVATSFFAPTGLLGALGIGTAATPIGWVAFAALASGGACYGFYRYLGNSKGSLVIEIPRFLNTPLDTLGLALFDLIAPLALRLALEDGQIDPEERARLTTHLVDDWGLDRHFVEQALQVIEPGLHEITVEVMAKELASFLHANPDCKHQVIAADLSVFLREMLLSAGALTAAEEQALAKVSALLHAVPEGDLANWWADAKATITPVGSRLADGAYRTADRIQSAIPSAQDVRTAAASASSSLQHGLKSAADAAQAALPTKEQLKRSADSVLSKTGAGVSWLRKKVRSK
ncbi:tellurite resistance TerB family protein [Ideonella dechloratans]|uniref:tellurite resistance TerB family protein n=1 Tax=Ideonella dechloratans TaxID=36863 RepID=UPI0035B0A347